MYRTPPGPALPSGVRSATFGIEYISGKSLFRAGHSVPRHTWKAVSICILDARTICGLSFGQLGSPGDDLRLPRVNMRRWKGSK